MTISATWKFKSRVPEAKAEYEADVLQVIKETTEQDMLPEAIRNSPYLTGNNARSITTETTVVPQGVQSQMYTQSGYGGYLEVGTHRMSGRPYMWPAFVKFQSALMVALERLRVKHGSTH